MNDTKPQSTVQIVLTEKKNATEKDEDELLNVKENSLEDIGLYNVQGIIDEREKSGKKAMLKLIIVSVLCILLMTAEIVGGVISGSLAILSDAAHMFSDFAGFALSIISLLISRRPATKILTYGYARAEVIGALASIMLIWGVTGWLLYEAVHRVIIPEVVNGKLMFWTAIFGLGCNLIMMKVLHTGHHHHHEGHGHEHDHSHSHGHDHKHSADRKHKHYNSNKKKAHNHKSDHQNDGHDHNHDHDHKEENGQADHDHDHDHDQHYDHDQGSNHDHNNHHNDESIKEKDIKPQQNRTHEHDDGKNKEEVEIDSHTHKNHQHDEQDSHQHHNQNSPKLDSKKGIIDLELANVNPSSKPVTIDQAGGVAMANTHGSKSTNKKDGHNHSHKHTHDHDHDHNHNHDNSQCEDGHKKKTHSHSNLNIQAALIHIIGDIVQSIGVIIAGTLIWINPNWHIADPICTFIFSVLVLFTTAKIFKRCLRMLMEGVPPEVDVEKYEKGLMALPGVINVHDLHVWSLSSGKTAMSAHVTSSDPQRTLKKATSYARKYGIYHSTLQVEKHDDVSHDYIVLCAHDVHK